MADLPSFLTDDELDDCVDDLFDYFDDDAADVAQYLRVMRSLVIAGEVMEVALNEMIEADQMAFQEFDQRHVDLVRMSSRILLHWSERLDLND